MKIVRYLVISVFVLGILFAAAYFIKTNSKSIKTYETESPFISSIERKTVVTGKVIPEDEVEIKRNYLKNELKEVVVKYANENCDKYGNIIENN